MKKKFYVFKLGGRWCAVQDESMESAKAYAEGFLAWFHLGRSRYYYGTHAEALSVALANLAAAARFEK